MELFRADFHVLAEMRIREARLLLDAGEFAGAYHLAGISIECALKACIAKQTREFEFPDKARVTGSYDHRPEKLVQLAGLESLIRGQSESDATFRQFWATICQWTIDSRYVPSLTAVQARDICTAVSDDQHGVLPWLRKHW